RQPRGHVRQHADLPGRPRPRAAGAVGHRYAPGGADAVPALLPGRVRPRRQPGPAGERSVPVLGDPDPAHGRRPGGRLSGVSRPDAALRRTMSSPVTSFAEGWNRFWFRPADPVPLAVMRICCGVVAFFLHLAYTPHLHELFGPDAWQDSQAVRELRKE